MKLSFRKKIANILFYEAGDAKESLIKDIFINALIMINICVILYYSYTKNTVDGLFFTFTFLSGLVYLSEFFLRLWSCVEAPKYRGAIIGRVKYVFSPLSILDVLSFIPILFSFGAVNTSFFRIFRLFDLGSYLVIHDLSPLTLLHKSIIKRIPEIIVLVVTFVALIILSAFTYNIIENMDSIIFPLEIIPSIELIISLIFGNETLGITTKTYYGEILIKATQIFGIFLIGLPTALVTGSFVIEIASINEFKRLKSIEGSLSDAFDVISPIPVRKYLKNNNIRSYAREILIDDVVFRLGLNIEDVKIIASKFRCAKVRSIKEPVSNISRISIEKISPNTTYGTLNHGDSNILIVSTQNAGEPSLNHFATTLADNVNASYIANQFYSSGALIKDLRINFSKNPIYLNNNLATPEALVEFKKDLTGVLKSNKINCVVYLTSMSHTNPENVRLRLKGINSRAVKNFVAENNAVINDWKESEDSILSLISRSNDIGILKIAVSTRILRTSDTKSYFESIKAVLDCIINFKS